MSGAMLDGLRQLSQKPPQWHRERLKKAEQLVQRAMDDATMPLAVRTTVALDAIHDIFVSDPASIGPLLRMLQNLLRGER